MADTATILAVDDNDHLRNLIDEVLTEAGFRVLSAPSAEVAMVVLEGDERIDLLFTDIVMPGLNGMALARVGRRLRPDMRVLFSSAYWPYIVTEPDERDLIRKPYRPRQLVDRVRDALGTAALV